MSIDLDSHIVRHLFINSASRNSPTPTNSNNFSINVDFPSLNWEYVSLSAISIPNSTYTISSGFNTFNVITGSGLTLITITPGYYNQTTFLTAVLAALNIAAVGGYTYDGTYSAITNKYTFTISGGSGSIGFTFGTSPGLADAMGFGPTATYPFVGGSLTSTESVNLPFLRAILVKSDIVDSSQDSNLSTLLNVNQFANLGYIYYEEQQPFYRKRAFTASGSNTFQFTLCDQSGKLLDINNEDWTMTLILIAHGGKNINNPQSMRPQ